MNCTEYLNNKAMKEIYRIEDEKFFKAIMEIAGSPGPLRKRPPAARAGEQRDEGG